MPTVGTLVVDLTANTATFQSDLGKAAKSAENFGKSASAAGEATSFSMMEAKGSMMLLGEELGVHIPRHLQTLIAEIPMVGAAFAELLPVVGVVAAIAIISKLIEKNAEAKEKFTQDWTGANTEVQNVFNKLSDRMLDAGIKADELAGNHLAAVAKQLQKIDNMSMRELVAGLGTIAKAADHVFEDLKSHWYELGGSEDAKKQLDEFKTKYEALMSVGNKAGAAELLKTTLQAANAELSKDIGLQGSMYAVSEKRLKSEEEYVARLKDAVTLEQKSAELAAADKANVKKEDAQKATADAFKESSKIMHEAMQTMKDEAIAAAKADEEWLKVQIQMAKEGEKSINGLVASKQKEAEEWVKLTEKMISEETRHAQVMAELSSKDGGQSKNGETKRFQEQMAAYEKERSLLTSTGEQRVADEQKIDHKEEEEAQKHQNKMDELTRKGEQQRADIAKKFADMTLFEHKSIAAATEQISKQMLSDLVNNTLQSLMVREDAAAREKLIDAKSAAASAFKSVMNTVPFPLDFALAPVAAAAAFAGVMAFEMGGEVPGSGAYPAIVHGGETVVTKALTEQVKNSTGGGGGGGHTVHVTTHIHAVDAENFGKLLDKHASVVSAHVTGQLRKLNKKG